MIICDNLHKQFKTKTGLVKAVDGVSFRAEDGQITGLLGPNGAGKTTTLRLILGLLKNQTGSITIFGKEFEANRVEVLQNIGSLIEAPSLYAHLTAKENLAVWQKIYQCPKERIAEVLEIVGLANTGKKRAGKFSLGMKQRLSIAIALLHNPKLLILDEPTNGLDPNGIIEIRELLKKLNADLGTTVVISSHLLAEIEKMVTHVGIIHKGSILFQGTLNDLHLKQSQSSVINFSTDNADKTMQIITANGLTPLHSNGMVTIPITDNQTIAKINAELVNSGVQVYGIATVKNDLESIFMDLVKN
jgi:ABC-2 type transport system ATP-binding protein